MREVAVALATALDRERGARVGRRAEALRRDLEKVDAEVRSALAAVPPERRVLVTGHESMGYFADRYGFRLIGAVIPSLSSQAQASAEGLAELRDQVRAAGVPAIFNEVGTPDGVAEAVADETGARLVEVGTHALPDDGSYLTFVREAADAVAGGLRPGGETAGALNPPATASARPLAHEREVQAVVGQRVRPAPPGAPGLVGDGVGHAVRGADLVEDRRDVGAPGPPARPSADACACELSEGRTAPTRRKP